MSVMPFTSGLAMDLGTANTLIYEKGRGIVLNEPSMVAINSETRKVLAIGHEAKSYLGRTPKGMEVIRPFRSGVISDFTVAQQMIKLFLDQSGSSRRVFRPKVLVGVPTGVTQVEKRAIIEAAESSGSKSVHLVDEPLAAAVGLGLKVAEPVGRLILDVGGGTSEGVILSLGAVAISESRRVAGDEATEAIARYIRRKYQMAIGENMAERIKMTIGSALPLEQAHVFDCRGKELKTGIPMNVEISDEDIREALEEINAEFISMVKLLLSRCAPEMVPDLVRDGIHLTGGGGLLKGLDKRLAKEAGLAVHLPKDPLTTMVMGLGGILENMRYYKDIFAN
ncbi:rod shape-determining protein [Deltaproteobacteria bacterium Smac51]|nr:rod shape-determining protein [Deltaproteobacteria bacterium Smac51]